LSGDATNLIEPLRAAGLDKADAIVTSPPYLGVLRYGAFNWIRLWFLSKTPATVDRMLDVTDSLDRYLSFLASFLLSASKVVGVGSPVVLVIGDVVESGQRLELAARVWEEMEGLVPYKLLWIDVDQFDQTTKTTRIWGEERKGRATPLDRVLVLERTSATESGVMGVRRRRNTK
jgi:site-specific DNA-methyltransferase (adenine-specific)